MANSPRLAELADLITRREYNYAIGRARKHEEDLVRRYAKDHDMEYTTLADTIEELYHAQIISDVSRENLHMIRHLGNKAVHESDNDASDAKTSYDLLKKELTTYSDQKYTNPERTPVAVRREAENGEYEIRRRMREREAEGTAPGFPDQGRRRQNLPERRGGRRDDDGRGKQDESTLYTVLKVLIPVLIIVLVVILAISIIKGGAAEETTAAPTTEETTFEETETAVPETTEEETTTEAETETEPQVTYVINGEGVNVRFASNPDEKYGQLGNGTNIGTVEPYENTTGNDFYDGFVKFVYDDRVLIVKQDYIKEAPTNQ